MAEKSRKNQFLVEVDYIIFYVLRSDRYFLQELHCPRDEQGYHTELENLRFGGRIYGLEDPVEAVHLVESAFFNSIRYQKVNVLGMSEDNGSNVIDVDVEFQNDGIVDKDYVYNEFKQFIKRELESHEKKYFSLSIERFTTKEVSLKAYVILSSDEKPHRFYLIF